MSGKHETANRPGAVGFDKTKGYKFGSHQISTKGGKDGKGTMPAFLSQLKKVAPNLHAPLAAAGGAAAAKAGSKPFMDAWHKVTKINPRRFANLQQSFVKSTQYNQLAHMVDGIKGFDLAHRSAAVKEALWSAAVKYGPAEAFKKVSAVLKGKDLAHLTDKLFLLAFYKELASIGARLKGLAVAERDKIQAGLSRELGDVLKLAKGAGRKVSSIFKR